MHVEFYGVCIVGNLNGTRCRDGVKVLCMVSFPSSLVGFLGFHPTCMRLFSFRKLFCDLFLLFVVVVVVVVVLYCCLGIVREEVGGEAEGKMYGL